MSFFYFQRLCQKLEAEPSYTTKTSLVKEYLKKSKQSKDFPLYTFFRLLLIKEDQRVFHMGDKKLLQVCAMVLGEDTEEMHTHFRETSGDASLTIVNYFGGQSSSLQPRKRSLLSLRDVDAWLDELVHLTKLEQQRTAMTRMIRRCTLDDIKWLARLIRHDLRAKTGAKHALAALHQNAFSSFQKCQNLKLVCETFADDDGHADGGAASSSSSTGAGAQQPKKKKAKTISALGLQVFQPIKPMLAKVTKSYDDAVKRCPKMRVELKYDGERIQIHYENGLFKFFSRNLKPVLEWKIKDLKPFFRRATSAKSIVLDAEILLLSASGQPLPFGSLNKHKKTKHKGATTLDERREILEGNVSVVDKRILFSRLNRPNSKLELQTLMHAVMRQNQEGLVIKDGDSQYQPGKRAWLKMKKDHLKGEEPADTLDLVVVGAWYGTGNKAGKLTTLLMAARNDATNRMHTVCKCGNGLDDATTDANQASWHKLFKECPSFGDVPGWLSVERKYVPDVVAVDPKMCPVYEILTSEFTETNHHTAGFSLRFPRFVRLRDDKDFATSTSLQECKAIVAMSKVVMVGEGDPGDEDELLGGTQPSQTAAAAPPSTETPPIMAAFKRGRFPSHNSTPTNTGSGRPTCKYDDVPGGCTRENPTHFQSFAHPERHRNSTECRYGAACYRKQAAHWKSFKHPDEDGTLANKRSKA